MENNRENKKGQRRPPIVCVMGHVDHGKSTLLDYIRKTNMVDKEAGGITQHIGAYEVEHKKSSGEIEKITFLDTPGHEAFGAIRSRGALIADIAILVVSAEDGVKPQTLDAYSCIKVAEIPFIVAITKIDKPNADVEKTKQSLAENEIYLEGYGGNVPWIPVSSKTGEGIPELLELIELVSEMEEISGDPEAKMEGFVIESHLDKKRGAVGTVIIKNRKISAGGFVASLDALAPLRILENYKGESLKEARPGMPLCIIGWSKIPAVGAPVFSFPDKKSAEIFVSQNQKESRTAKNLNAKEKETATVEEQLSVTIPIIIKADASSSLDAINHELKKIESEKIKIKVILEGVGDISENDAKLAESSKEAIILGFNVKTDTRAKMLAERGNIEIKIFDIIYKLSEWLAELLLLKTPKMRVEEKIGTAKIQKIFSKDKDHQIVGGKVLEGEISVGEEVKIMRKEIEIGRGKIRELQRQKVKTSSVPKDNEFGTMIDAKITIAPGDFIESFKIVEK